MLAEATPQVKNVFTLLLDSSQAELAVSNHRLMQEYARILGCTACQDNNPKKREDVLKKLEELYVKLQPGTREDNPGLLKLCDVMLIFI